jgi:hypothetical protein
MPVIFGSPLVLSLIYVTLNELFTTHSQPILRSCDRASWNIPIIKPTRCTDFSNLFLEWNSTCFGQFLCPSSGVFHCKHSHVICHTILQTACEQDQDETAVPLHTWSGPEGSKKLSFPNFLTTVQYNVKVVSLTYRPPLPPENTPGTHFC